MTFAKAYGFTLAAFLVIDLIWLGVVARGFYVSQLGPLLRDNPLIAPAALFYLAYVAGIVWFAVNPALADGSWRTAVLNGAILGLLAYGTYDMTNLATLKGWPLGVSIVDMLWGGAITAVSASLGYLGVRALG
jgi:uncharacterized membrane protein